MTAFRYSTNLIIPDVSSIKDDVGSKEMTYVFNALRTLATRIDETTGAIQPPEEDWPNISPTVSDLGNNIYRLYVQCGPTAISYGMFVNFYNATASTVLARPAQANGYANVASGFCIQSTGVAPGEWGEFNVGPGLNYGISGLTPGNQYFLSPTSPGLITATQPTAVGQVIQVVGQAITDRIVLTGAFNNWLQI